MESSALQLSEWKWEGESLPIPIEPVDPKNSVDLTASVLDQLRKCHYNDARALIESNKTIARLITLKELRDKGAMVLPKLDLDRQQKMSALAAFFTVEKKNTDSCKQCRSRKSRGPCSECIAGDDDLFNGACTNCQFSSTASACSFYKGSKGKRRARSGSAADEEEDDDFTVTAEYLQGRSMRELELFRKLIDEEVAFREVNHTRNKRRRT